MSDSPPNEWEPPVDPLLRTNQSPPAPSRDRHSSPSISKRRHPARGARALALAASVTATVGIAGAMARADTQSDTSAVQGSDSPPDSVADPSPGTMNPTSEPSGSTEPGDAEQTSSDLDQFTDDLSEDGSQLHRRQGGGRQAHVDTTTDADGSTEFQTEASTPEPAPEPSEPLSEEPVVDSSSSLTGWSDGTWSGTAEYTEWGDVQVEARISAGRLIDIAVLQVPSDRKSTNINDSAIPVLEAQAIGLQSADLDIVSGATYTSRTYADSLQAALDQSALAQGG